MSPNGEYPTLIKLFALKYAYGVGIFPLGEDRMSSFPCMIYSLIHSTCVCSAPTKGMAQRWALLGSSKDS